MSYLFVVIVASKHVCVATKVCLLRQNYVCRDKYLSWQTFWHAKNMFVATSMLLSQQKRCFVTTKIILVAAPANDCLFRLILLREAFVYKLNLETVNIGTIHKSAVSDCCQAFYQSLYSL